MATHIVWDWNGTLLDDLDVIVAATTDSFAMRGLPAVTVEDYRNHFTRPVQLFYERLLGRPLTDGEWEDLDEDFHAAYRKRLASAELALGARELLASWEAEGRSQSLLSMWRHDELVPLVRSLGIDAMFRRVDGLRGISGGSKEGFLVDHLRALVIDTATVVMIGDSVDDADAAAAVGVPAILVASGMQGYKSLVEAGVPVVGSIGEAVELAYAA